MISYQEAFTQIISDIPYKFYADVIIKKFNSEGIKLSNREQDKLVSYLKSNNLSDFRIRNWRWWNNKKIEIDFNPEELELLDNRTTEFLKLQLPDLIQTISEEISKKVLIQLIKRWDKESKLQNRDIRGFQKRLYSKWGTAIERLRMFITISREFGDTINTNIRTQKNNDNPNLCDVITRLHARACQVTEEIVSLIKSGFSDGAMARWRTLHEISSVTLFLNKYGEDTAKRYIQHQTIEAYKAAKDYQKCCEKLGYEPLSYQETLSLKNDVNYLINLYGKPYKTQYGWAAESLGKDRPTLFDIEQEAGIEHLRSHYSMASNNVHANPNGIYFKLGLIKETDILLAGPSDIGFADPGQGAAVSLLQITTTLGLLSISYDTLISMQVMSYLVEKIKEDFISAKNDYYSMNSQNTGNKKV